ncbi:MAG: HAD family hydrolase [Acutalibacteraceae bacterium]
MYSLFKRIIKSVKRFFSRIKLKIVRTATTWNGWLLRSFYREQKPKIGRFRKALYLIFLNLSALFGCGIRHNRVSAAERRKYTLAPYTDKPETQHCKRLSYTFIAKKILLHDVISFDVFDTLLLRPFDDPKTLFYLVGEKLKCPGFCRYRVLAEKQARAINTEKNGTNEVTLIEIYQQLNRYFIIDPEHGAAVEEQTELELCMPHPYMKQIYDIAVSMNKTVIAVTDMYLPPECIMKMLNKCGYRPDELFVSNAYGVSKRQGGLYEAVKKKYPQKKILHFGDNYTADVFSAQQNGIDAVFMRSVASYGKNHRPYDMTALVGSAYRGVVNNKLCSGAFTANAYYEFGYAYAGFLVLGYCNFIHEKAKSEHIDKVFFLSRDGDILKQVYNMLYPDDAAEYIYWSRAAATWLTSGVFRNEFLLRYIKYKIPNQITVGEMCAAMKLPEMEKQLIKRGIQPKTFLTNENYEQIVQCVIDNWDLIDEKRERMDKAAREYFDGKIENAKKVMCVDVGWAASGFSAIRNLVENVWKFDCEVCGAVVGANYLHDQNIIEAPLLNGKMYAYAFSQRKNREIKEKHYVRRLYSVFIEMMLSSPTPSFLGFEYDSDGNIKYLFDLPETEGFEYIRDIQSGIKDFVCDYTTAFAKYPYMMNICGADAYEVCRFVISQADYFINLFGDYPVNRAVGTSGYETETLKTLIEREYKK